MNGWNGFGSWCFLRRFVFLLCSISVGVFCVRSVSLSLLSAVASPNEIDLFDPPSPQNPDGSSLLAVGWGSFLGLRAARGDKQDCNG
jgi:hypothetical protein